MSELWYVAYGSNTSTAYFAERLGHETSRWRRDVWVWLPYELYFGGSSQTWDGSPVAFISLTRSDDERTLGRAYLMARSALDSVLEAEHLRIATTWDFDVLQLPAGGWCPIPTRAKYNAVMRLDDIEQTPAFTITSARWFTGGTPNADYLSVCRDGLAASGLPDVDGYLDTAVDRSLRRTRAKTPPRPSAPYSWRKELAPTKTSTGYPTVQLGEEDRWLQADGPVPGHVEHDGRLTRVWFLPPTDGAECGASVPVFRALGVPANRTHLCRLVVDYPVQLRRLPARSDDVEIADAIQVSRATASTLRDWCLLTSPSLSGPVRLSPRAATAADAARVGYATRELWEFDSDHGTVYLMPLPPDNPGRSLRSRLARYVDDLLSRGARKLLGAPEVPLRATEGVVGDEGHAVVRIDPTALDFLGVSAGDEIIVSWADRQTRARALLQTDELRRRMRDQLAQTTGRQSRLSTRARMEENANILWHLQAWLSPRVRDSLTIPPDTVVRVRRSVRHALLRYLIVLELPVGGLIVAVLAIPGVPLWAKILVPVSALLVALIPLRVSRI